VAAGRLTVATVSPIQGKSVILDAVSDIEYMQPDHLSHRVIGPFFLSSHAILERINIGTL
jgi:hypothetical protein